MILNNFTVATMILCKFQDYYVNITLWISEKLENYKAY